MSLEVLLSAMHLDDYRYINSLNIAGDCVVINQCEHNDCQSIIDNGRHIKYICTTERGLSRSRNMAITNASAEICIFCDNDVEYLPDYEKTIMTEFQEHPDYDLIVFFIKRTRANSKPYFPFATRMGYITTLKVFSPEVAFRRQSLIDKGIKLKVEFGAGSQYAMGEENIFMYNCLQKGLKILYVPRQIASLRQEESTWFKGYTKKFFLDKGAIYYEMSHLFSGVLILQFALRKRHRYGQEMSFGNAVRYMLEGRRNYIDSLSS